MQDKRICKQDLEVSYDFIKKKKTDGTYFDFDKILRKGYEIDEQENEIAKKQMANGKRKRLLHLMSIVKLI